MHENTKYTLEKLLESDAFLSNTGVNDNTMRVRTHLFRKHMKKRHRRCISFGYHTANDPFHIVRNGRCQIRLEND